MRRLLLIFLLALPLSGETVTLLHFSDYHSHAQPFYTDEGERGGIARAIGYLREQKKAGAFVFNGGDMMNKGAPAWSDRYRCVEWDWLNGVVDAMAFGNHDADYGGGALDDCRAAIRYPILSANTPGFQPYRVLTRGDLRIGVFAIAGADFPQLVKAVPFTFGDPVAAARAAVAALREKEHVDAVVMIGHQGTEADYALAAAVPGIDLIFGTHSHLKRELTRIPGTSTWFISPSQYLTFISRVELTFDDGKRLRDVRGELVPVDERLKADRCISKRVARLQKRLERDPLYRDLFTPIGRLEAPLPVEALAEKTLATMRSATGAEVALSTASSFRRPLPAGVLTLELLRGALPYDNEIVVCTMSGAELKKALDRSGSREEGDSRLYVSGPLQVVASQSYRVATTDYLANVAYRDVVRCEWQKSGLRVRDELRKALAGGE